PRGVPGGAAAYVARAVGPIPREGVATLSLGAGVGDLAEVLRWVDHDVVEATARTTVIRIRGEDEGRLAMTVARIALAAPVRVVEPGALARAVERLGAHLTPGHRP